jgi:hypothetical protein
MSLLIDAHTLIWHVDQDDLLSAKDQGKRI